METDVDALPTCEDTKAEHGNSQPPSELAPDEICRTLLRDLFESKSSSDKLYTMESLFVRRQMRYAFLNALSQRRAQPPGVVMTETAFSALCYLMESLLIRAEPVRDFKSFKLSIHLASTFYRRVERSGEVFSDYLTHYLANSNKVSIWRAKAFWNEIYYDEVLSEKEKQAELYGAKAWKDTDVDQKTDMIIHEKNVYFATLGTFTHLMLTFGVTSIETKLFIKKQCHINNLSDEHMEMLLGNLDSVAGSVAEQEAKRDVAFFPHSGNPALGRPGTAGFSHGGARKKSGPIRPKVRDSIRKQQLKKQGKKMEAKLQREMGSSSRHISSEPLPPAKNRRRMAHTIRRKRSKAHSSAASFELDSKGVWEIDVTPLARVRSDPALSLESPQVTYDPLPARPTTPKPASALRGQGNPKWKPASARRAVEEPIPGVGVRGLTGKEMRHDGKGDAGSKESPHTVESKGDDVVGGSGQVERELGASGEVVGVASEALSGGTPSVADKGTQRCPVDASEVSPECRSGEKAAQGGSEACAPPPPLPNKTDKPVLRPKEDVLRVFSGCGMERLRGACDQTSTTGS